MEATVPSKANDRSTRDGTIVFAATKREDSTRSGTAHGGPT
jgi:hypothetical protein